MSLSSFFSSFVSSVYADAPAEEPKEEVKEESEPEAEAEAEAEPEAAAAEEEEEEPEDALPALVEECQESKACAAAAKHFAHCEEKVNDGKGYLHEDCVEEFMMHCVNDCVAPKLFSKLK